MGQVNFAHRCLVLWKLDLVQLRLLDVSGRDCGLFAQLRFAADRCMTWVLSVRSHSLSVSFIQMLKAFNPVVILLISFAFRLQEPNQRLVGVVAVGSRSMLVLTELELIAIARRSA
jgi:hypothetical protein